MRPTRLLALLGMAAGVAALVMPSLATDSGLVEDLSGMPVPSIWASMARWEQWTLFGSVVVGAGLMVAARRSRLATAGAAIALLGAAYLVWQGRVDGVEAASRLAVDLQRVALAGGINASPGAEVGAGFLLSLAGLVAASLIALWEMSHPVGPMAPGEASAPEPATVGREPNAESRYIELIIESEDLSSSE